MEHRDHPRGASTGQRPPDMARRSARGGDIDVAKIAFGNKIDPKLYSDVAEEMARGVAGDNRAKNKPTQLRRFYDELVSMQSKVGKDKEEFERQQPFIQMLKAKVAYAKGRDKVDDNFVKLLGRVVDQAIDAGTLKQARLFMEAFMAFYKVYVPRD
jgi:CRISPR-associated protein Csm2